MNRCAGVSAPVLETAPNELCGISVEMRRPFAGRVHNHVLPPPGCLCEFCAAIAFSGRASSMNITIADFCFSMLLPALLNQIGRSTSVRMTREAAFVRRRLNERRRGASSPGAVCAIGLVGCCCITGTGAVRCRICCPALHTEASMFNCRPRDFSGAASFPSQPHFNPQLEENPQ